MLAAHDRVNVYDARCSAIALGLHEFPTTPHAGNRIAENDHCRNLVSEKPVCRRPSFREHRAVMSGTHSGTWLGIPWSALAPARRDPSGENPVELRLVGWLARELVVPPPPLDSVEDHREVASPEIGVHVDRHVHQAADHSQDDRDVALPDIVAQTTRRLGSLHELRDERLDLLP